MHWGLNAMAVIAAIRWLQVYESLGDGNAAFMRNASEFRFNSNALQHSCWPSPATTAHEKLRPLSARAKK
jgi:hypothetical protein